MKSRDSLIRSKRFQAEEKRRQVEQIEAMIAEFERMARELNDQILAEEERSGIRDTSHFAYPTFARAAAQRRDNLVTSAADLRAQRDAAQRLLDAALDELKRAELIAERGQDRGARAGVAPAGGRRRGAGHPSHAG